MSRNVMQMLAELQSDFEKKAEKPSGDTQPGPESGTTRPAQEGARSAENTADVKKNIQGETVDEAEENKEQKGSGENTPTNKGDLNAAPTGEDKEETTTKVKDPGTSHPAKAASASDIVNSSNELLAALAVFNKSAGLDTDDETEDKPKDKTKAEKEEKEDSDDDEEVTIKKAELDSLRESDKFWRELQGYEAGKSVAQDILSKAASQTNESDDETDEILAQLQKVAAEEAAESCKMALDDASNVVDFLYGFQKAAMGEIDPEVAALMAQDPAMAGGVDPAMAGGVDPAMMMGDGEEEQVSEEELLALLAELEASGIPLEEILGAEAGGEVPAEAEAEQAAAAQAVDTSSSDEGAEEDEIAGEKLASAVANLLKNRKEKASKK